MIIFQIKDANYVLNEKRLKKMTRLCKNCDIPTKINKEYYDDGSYHIVEYCDKCGAEWG